MAKKAAGAAVRMLMRFFCVGLLKCLPLDSGSWMSDPVTLVPLKAGDTPLDALYDPDCLSKSDSS